MKRALIFLSGILASYFFSSYIMAGRPFSWPMFLVISLSIGVAFGLEKTMPDMYKKIISLMVGFMLGFLIFNYGLRHFFFINVCISYVCMIAFSNFITETVHSGKRLMRNYRRLLAH